MMPGRSAALVLLGVVALGTLLAGCTSAPAKGSNGTAMPGADGSGVSPAPGGIVQFTIRVTENGFENQTAYTIHAHVGDRLRIVFLSAEPYGDVHPVYTPCFRGHTATVTAGDTSAETSQAVMEFTADQATTCGFSCQNPDCHLHPKLQNGQLIVEA